MLLEFFREGGWVMWPILVFGMVTLGAAGRFAQKPEMKALRFIGSMATLTLVATFHGTLADVAAVFRALSDEKRIPDAEITRTAFAGFMECTRPGLLGVFLLMLACLFVAIGMLRADKKQP